MDVYKALRELYGEKKRLDRLIAKLEAKRPNEPIPMTSPRGRRFMSEAERREVSRRMTNYWIARKAARGNQALSEAQAVTVARQATA